MSPVAEACFSHAQALAASDSITCVMYHYVRPIARGAFPGLRGLETEAFAGQLDYIDRHYTPVSIDLLIKHLNGEGVEWPSRPIILTFDDGYRDHFDYVLPELQKRRMTGAFYPVGMSALDREVMPANKVQFMLASIRSIDTLIEDMEKLVGELDNGLTSLAEYRERYFRPSRIDSAEVIYVKRMLQTGLPPALRATITDRLFKRYVTDDEKAFADELYMSIEHLKALVDAGHHVGCHGESHQWMGSLSGQEQRQEILGGLRIHDRLGLPRRGFSFSFPYGDYDANCLQILSELGCATAFTVEVGLIRPSHTMRLTLPRLDTIDLPVSGEAAVNAWTAQASATAH